MGVFTVTDPKTCPHCGEDHNGVTGCRPKVSDRYKMIDGMRMYAPDLRSEPKPATEPAREWQIEKNYDHRHISGPNTLGEHGQLVRVKVVEASRLIDARLTLIDQEVSRQSALKLLDAANAEIERINVMYTAMGDKAGAAQMYREAAERERDEWKKKYEADVITAVLCKDMEIADKLIAAYQCIADYEKRFGPEEIVQRLAFDDQAEAWRAAAMKLAESIREHVTCEPGQYGNECVGLGGADGLRQSLAEFDAFVAKEKKK